MACLRRFKLVSAKNVVVEQRRSTEERKAARTAHHTAKDVLGRFLQPVTNRVLELLVPYHRTRTDWMNAAASGSHLFVLLHAVYQKTNSLWPEVNVAVQREQKSVLGLLNKNYW